MLMNHVRSLMSIGELVTAELNYARRRTGGCGVVREIRFVAEFRETVRVPKDAPPRGASPHAAFFNACDTTDKHRRERWYQQTKDPILQICKAHYRYRGDFLSFAPAALQTVPGGCSLP
jgi:hypothetical protein